MKKYVSIIVVLSLILTINVLSQIPDAITIDPPWSSAFDELTLTFDAELACSENSALTGLPFVAIHSGIALESGEVWEFLIQFDETGANGQSTALMPAGDGRYSITYTPSEFYGIPEYTEVTHICAVFNNGINWNQDGRDFDINEDCTDFFIPLQKPMPEAISIVSPGASACDEISLYFDPSLACFENGSLVGSGVVGMHSGVTLQSGDEWQYFIQFNEPGANGQMPVLEPTGDGRYVITFVPNEFYGIAEDELIVEICAVFNNGSNWTQDGRDFDENGECADFYIPLLPPKFTVDLKVFLEGPFNGNEMSADLYTRGFIPLIQPYNIPPWDYQGTETVDAIPNSNIVDWIYVQFREANEAFCAGSASTVKQQAAFLLKDGSVVDIDGVSKLTYDEPFLDNLYVVINHRNHLPVLSANPITGNTDFYNYDFTTSIDQAYESGQKALGNIFGMIGGNGFPDDIIDETDKVIDWEIEAGNCGYSYGDFDLDGEVQNQDKDHIWHDNNGEISQLPNEIPYVSPPSGLNSPLQINVYSGGILIGLEIHFQWNGSPEAIGYNLYSSTSSSSWPTTPDLSTTGTTAIKTYGCSYWGYTRYFRVKAYDECSESGPSNTYSVYIPGSFGD